MRCPAGLFEARNVVDRGLGDGCQRLAREKALMACDEDIRECQEARENIILQHGFRQISEKEVAFFFIDIEAQRSEEHTSELQSLMRISYAVFCLTKKTEHKEHT